MEYSAPSFFAAGYWLRRYNPDGALVWCRRYDGTHRMSDLVVVGDDIFIAGTDGHYYSKPLVQRASFVTGELGDHDLTDPGGPEARSRLLNVEVWAVRTWPSSPRAPTRRTTPQNIQSPCAG